MTSPSCRRKDRAARLGEYSSSAAARRTDSARSSRTAIPLSTRETVAFDTPPVPPRPRSSSRLSTHLSHASALTWQNATAASAMKGMRWITLVPAALKHRPRRGDPTWDVAGTPERTWFRPGLEALPTSPGSPGLPGAVGLHSGDNRAEGGLEPPNPLFTSHSGRILLRINAFRLVMPEYEVRRRCCCLVSVNTGQACALCAHGCAHTSRLEDACGTLHRSVHVRPR